MPREPYLPDLDKLTWMRQAACRDLPTRLFFPTGGRKPQPAVLELCRTCPVRYECLQYAYDRKFHSGYFGGLSAGQRRRHPDAASAARAYGIKRRRLG